MPLQAGETRIEKYDKVTGDLWMRTFAIADDIITMNNWLAKNSKIFGQSLKGKYVIDYEKNPQVHTNYTNLQKWLKDSSDVAVGPIESVDWNDSNNSLDIIYKVTDPEYKKIILAGKFDKKFSSPAIWGYKLRRDPNTGLKIYDEWEGVHVALLRKNPAFPNSIAQINENICIGGIKCANELAAVAVNNNFISFDNTEKDKDIPESNKMSEVENKKTIPYEEYVKVKNDFESLNGKYSETLKVNEKISKDHEALNAKAKQLEDSIRQRDIADKTKDYTERLAKIFEKEDAEAKAKAAAEKNYDIDEIYGSLLKQAEEKEKAEAESKSKNQLGKAGVGSAGKMTPGLQTNPKNTDTRMQNVELARRIVGMGGGS